MSSKRTIILLLVVWFAALTGWGQTTYERTFTYDMNGNRIACTILVAKAGGGNGAFQPSAADTLAGVSIRIYPNPTNDKVFVATGTTEDVPTMKAVLMTETGAVLEEKRLAGTENFDLTGKASGLYYLEISNNKEKLLWKVLKR